MDKTSNLNIVGFKKLNEGAVIPTRAHETDSGFDLYANEDVIIYPEETKVIKTNIAVILPEGLEAQVRPRSGITSRTNLRVQLGTIDNGYRGDIGIIVDNISSKNTFKELGLRRIDGGKENPQTSYQSMSTIIKKGDKIAQLVVQHLPEVISVEVEGDVEETERGENGYGSTDTKEEIK